MRKALAWVDARDPIPDPSNAWLEPNGLVCAGQDLSAERLLEAYAKGVFPWYSPGQPVLWWSPDPRMVLQLDDFTLHRSLRKTLLKVRQEKRWQLSLNRCFGEVMRACAQPRDGQAGSWITEDVIAAYSDLHRLGLAHSFEVWETAGSVAIPPRDNETPGQLVAGLYGVSIGKMFFGESMFTHRTDASKLAFVGLVSSLRSMGFSMIDCQQNTRHLASFGAREIPRELFLKRIVDLMRQTAPDWQHLCDPVGNLDWPSFNTDGYATNEIVR
jgi:leucyl/phenylalanyl-tRNA---protein transferase